MEKDRFKAEWQRRHHPAMDVSGDADFYYDAYLYIYHIAESQAKRPSEDCIIRLVMYIEDNATVGIAPVYERMYRSLGDLVGHWCKVMEMSAEGRARVSSHVTDAIVAAPKEGSLRKWIEESVRSRDFRRLEDIALFFARQDNAPGLVFPNLSHRKSMYTRLAKGDSDTAQRMLRADMAFNWRDKQGLTLLHRLAERFARIRGKDEASNSLASAIPTRMEAYLPGESHNGHVLTLLRKDGPVFRDVFFPAPLPPDYRNLCFIGQLVTYLGTTYVSGPGLWTDRQAHDQWDGDALWQSIETAEKNDARNAFFTTAFGKKTSRYEDLYLTPENPMTAYYNGLGIYLDEPNLLDFLEWQYQPEPALLSTD